MSSLTRIIAFGICLTTASVGAEDPGPDITYFEKHVRPLLVTRCGKCHSSDSESVGGNLLLDSRDGWIAGGDLGPAIVPGDPDGSLLIRAIKQESDDLQMPPEGRLDDSEIRHLENWVRRGAVDPRQSSAAMQRPSRKIDFQSARDHWSFQPLGPIEVPDVEPERRAWSKSTIDRLVAWQQQSQGIVPVARADRQTFIRRVTFDLLGVPPTPQEIDHFVSDSRPGADARLIDRLFASPRYGERWGRHWLDVARYADSNGLDENAAHGNAWRYRDYVIDSFNDDLTYDQFLREQLAGDQLASADESLSRRRRIATGFLVLGPKVLAEGDEKKMEMDIIDEQIETVGRAFMGLTLGCARCHDHKFDPISTRDYYALAGIFGSTKTMEQYKRVAKWNEVSVATPEQLSSHARHQEQVATARKNVDAFVKQANQTLLASLGDGAKLPKTPESQYDEATKQRLAALRAAVTEEESAVPKLPAAMAVSDRPEPADQPVLIRGSHLTPAESVTRGFPAVLVSHRGKERFAIPEKQSGRLQLADWLSNQDHPLVARVMVNRIWRWHFGRGIAPSTDNFGLLGERPTHPALLDWLAAQFIADGWSIKKLQRRILLSATYRLASVDDERNSNIDPNNDSLWRFNVRRLEAEELLDSMHDVGGMLDLQMGGSMLTTENRVLVFNHTSEDMTTYESTRRAVYLPVIRNHLADVFQLFDYAEASVMTSDRPSTTVAPQALFLMNGEITNRASRQFAERLLRQADRSDADRMQEAYRLALGRRATDLEVDRGVKYLDLFAGQFADLDRLQARRRAWQMFCQTLISSSEFCFLR